MRNFDYSIKMLNSFQAEFLFNLFVFICAFSLILYLPRIRYYIAGLKKPRRAFNQEKKSLAVIVPAKNEKGLRVLLDSLAAQTYDKDFYDIHVVVGDKNDPNIELCKSYKNCFSKVIENQTCKGEALDGILQDLLQEGKRKYEGFVIVDADNSVSDRVYPQKADFTFYGGIYRDVNLIIVDRHHFALDYFGGPGIRVTARPCDGYAAGEPEYNEQRPKFTTEGYGGNPFEGHNSAKQDSFYDRDDGDLPF